LAVKIGRRLFFSKEDAYRYFSSKLKAMKNKDVFWDDEIYNLFRYHPLKY